MHTCAALVRRWWNNLKTISKRQKYTFVFALLAIIVTLFFVPNITHAQIDQNTFSGAILIAFTKFFLWLASLGIQLAIFFLKFFILLAGYNGFINADIVKFGWNIVRDVANMFFIVILLVIAFGTILGLEQYEWKKSLPKLVFAAIFVNFSNVICQIIIDISQVFTITFLNAVAGTAGGNLINIMKFDDVFTLLKSGPPVAGTDILGDILIGSLFAVFFCFIAAASIGSYMIVMLYRMVTLWCLIILSPLAFLFSILPTTKSYADEFWKEFISHVIAAPMMVFFLWLAFATFGAGSIVETNIQNPDNNSIARQGFTLDSDSEAVGAQTGVTISKATSWMNLANFAVAIGFLYIGIERVQKLGVRGGDYIQRGMDFGKRAFNIAAGIELARWGHGKGTSALGSAAGWAADKVPLIGRDSLKRYGTSIAGYSKMQANRFKTVRDDKAVKWGEKLAAGMGGGIIGGMAGRAVTGILQSNARADKLAQNWATAGEAAEKRWDEEVSTSKSASGKAKLTEGVKLDIATELSGQKKRQKFADERDRLQGLNGGDGKFAKMNDEISRTSVRADLMEHKLHTEADRTKDREKSALLGLTGSGGRIGAGEVGKYQAIEAATIAAGTTSKILKKAASDNEAKHTGHEEGAQRAAFSALLNSAAGDKADAEEANKKIGREDEMSVSTQRDALLVAAGKLPRYVEATMAKFQKEDQELAGASSYDRVQGKLNNLKAQIPTTTDPALKATLLQELAQLQAFNVNRGAIFGSGGIDNIANDVTDGAGNHLAGVNSDDVLTSQAKVLAGLTNEFVEATDDGVEGALKKLEKQFGNPEKYLAFMRSFKDGLEKSADEGAVNLAGLFKEEVQANGSSIFRRTDINDADDKKHIDGKRGWARGQANFGKITSFTGATDTVRTANGKVVADASTPEARENLTKIFSKVTQNVANGINDGIIDDWNAMIQNMGTTMGGRMNINDLVNELKAKGNKQGLKTMFKRTDAATKAILDGLGHTDLTT